MIISSGNRRGRETDALPAADFHTRPDTRTVLDVRKSPELQAALLAMRQAERTVKSDINKDARSKLKPLWTSILATKAVTTLDRRGILPGARVAVSDRSVRAIAAGSSRALSGGLIPSIDYGPLEWGANIKQRTVQARSTKGRAYSYSRRQGKQFRPWSKQGHVAMHAAGDLVSKAVAIWVETIVDGFRGSFEVHR